MTGLAFSRAIWTARFCTSGTCSSGSSTPRSPRATMMPSKARTIASRLSTASGFSSLAITGSRAPVLVHDLVDLVDVGRAAHERQRDDVDAQAEGELEVRAVLLRHRRHGHVHPGQRQALVVADRAALGDPADHVVALDGDDPQADLAVVDQQPVVRAGVGGEALVRGGDPVVGAGHVVDGDPHLLAGAPLQRARAGREPAQPDLRPLQVGEDPDGVALGVRGRADHVVHPLVVFTVAVAEVQPRDVHAGLDQLADPVRGGRGRPERTDDLCASTHVRGAYSPRRIEHDRDAVRWKSSSGRAGDIPANITDGARTLPRGRRSSR